MTGVVTGVLLTRGGGPMLEETLRWHRPHLDALVVVDNTPGGPPPCVLDMADLVIIPRWTDFADARNLPAPWVHTPWLLHFDSDERFHPDFLKRLRDLCTVAVGIVDSFRFPRRNPEGRDWPDHQVRLYRNGPFEWRGAWDERLWHREKGMLLDQWSCRTLDEYPIEHLSPPRDWATILKERTA